MSSPPPSLPWLPAPSPARAARRTDTDFPYLTEGKVRLRGGRTNFPIASFLGILY